MDQVAQLTVWVWMCCRTPLAAVVPVFAVPRAWGVSAGHKRPLLCRTALSSSTVFAVRVLPKRPHT